MTPKTRLQVVCLGASAGGLEALDEFFGVLSADTGAAYVVVVHLSPDFKSLMPELLARRTEMAVSSSEDLTELRPNHVYIIPPGTNMLVRDGRLRLEAQDRRPGHGLNLPIDLFLESMAKDHSTQGTAIILSGSGSDGSRGIQAVKDVGGMVFAQTPTSAKFDGMPISALQTGVVDADGTPAELARKVAHVVKNPLSVVATDEPTPDAELHELLDVLRNGGFEASHLRPQMVARRAQRRMAVTGTNDFHTYLSLVRRDATERAHLGRDLLIGVTQFFRDRASFDALYTKVFPELLQSIPPTEPFRGWVAGCSTGQEVYTVVVLLLEAMAAISTTREIRLFATDLNQEALKRASRGIYTLSEVADIEPTLLGLYFENAGNYYTVREPLRKSVIFARHDVVTDPPFTRLDLVTCRNLLIYLQPEAQQQVLQSLCLSLKPDHGVLMLGSAEDIGPLKPSFTPLVPKAKLFQRRGDAPPNSLRQTFLSEPLSIIHSEPGLPTAARIDEPRHQQLRLALETMAETEERSVALIDDRSRLRDVITDPLSLFRLPKGTPTDDLTASSLLP